MKIHRRTLVLTSLLPSLLFHSCLQKSKEGAETTQYEHMMETSEGEPEAAAEDLQENGNTGAYSWSESSNLAYTYDKVSSSAGSVALSAASHSQAPVQAKPEKLTVEKKIIKTADLRIQVEDIKKSSEKLGRLIASNKGYIGRMNEDNNSYRIQSDIAIRVPVSNFDSLLTKILDLGLYIHRKEIRANDVTEEYVDVQSRLKTKREVEKRYLEILKQAKTIEEILQVERHLASIREEIEAKEGRLKYLNDKVSFSTIELEMFQELEYKAAPVLEAGFFQKTGMALVTGWKGLLGFIIGIFYVWPLLLAAFISAFLVRRYFRRRKLKSREAA